MEQQAEWEIEDGIEEQRAPEGPGFWTVAISLCDRAYGGPEEGGWWYDCGEPSQSPHMARWTRVFTDKDMARNYSRRLNNYVCARANRGRRPRWSVLSDGEYGAIVHDGYPAAWPAKRPHYE